MQQNKQIYKYKAILVKFQIAFLCSLLTIYKRIVYQLMLQEYSETSSKLIKECQEEQKKISSEIETLKNLKQEEKSTIENYKLLKEKVNEFLDFKELNSLIVHSLISRIEVGYRDNPRIVKVYYKFIDDTF